MSEHEWQFGDWGREKVSSLIARFVTNDHTSQNSVWVFRDGSCGYNRRCEYLPDCTGWDWKPIEPPPGYRLLERGEKVRNWDMARKRDGTWIELLGGDGDPDTEQLPGYTYARKIEPQYRPFANAAEFTPHRERWIRRKQNEPHAISVTEYSDLGIWFCGKITCVTYEKAFKDFEFEHGEPFGVENK